MARKPGFYTHYNVNPAFQGTNEKDDDGNPTGGDVLSVGLNITWQDKPRRLADGTLSDPNGAFVEDVIFAALQRLEYFQESKFRCRENAMAITNLQEALWALKHRQLERSERGVEGAHEE